jgi:hypothetical protein
MNKTLPTNGTRRKASILFLLMPLCCALVAAKSATCVAAAPSAIFGDWEVTQVLVIDVGRDSPGGVNPDDGREVGRKYSLHMNRIVQDNEEQSCKLDTSIAKRTVPIKVLFAGEGLQRPKIIRERLHRRAAEYGVDFATNKSITVYAYRCKNKELQLNPMGNWFAATHDTVIWPLGLGALAIMKRQPTTPTTAQIQFCKEASSKSDKTICADRELWLMKSYTETVRDCAITARGSRTLAERRDQLNAYVEQRNRCEGDQKCVFNVLREHASIVGQSVPSVSECTALTKKTK